MKSPRRWTNRHQWIIGEGTPLHIAAAAQLTANCNLELQMSASYPGHPPEFDPHRSRFNGQNEPAEDVEYPTDFAKSQADSTGASVSE